MTTQTPVTLPITMMNLAKGKFHETPPQGSSPANNNPAPLENIPARAGTPWPEKEPLSENLFESRKDWPIPTVPMPTPTMKVEAQLQEMAIPHAMVAPKQIKEKCGWEPNCLICKNIEEDWYDDHQKQNVQQNIPYTQA